MKTFLIAVLCFGLSQAKPQYNYPAPAAPSPPRTSYGSPSSAINFGGSSSFAGGTSGSSSISGGSVGGFSGSGVSADSFGTGFGTGSGVNIGGAAGGTVQVQKHIYVHVAPPEPEETRQAAAIPAAQSTKHYKIIFIKAPSYSTYQQQLLQQQAQSEEKTLVYVLVKKPEDQTDITIPTAAPTQPSKPEVYFIKYKARSEAVGGAAAAGTASVSGSTGAATGGIAIGGSSTSSATRPTYGVPAQSGPY
ncbi:cell wall protein AWA1-like [Sitophilus oryzae]|uniref:Cell wall protein AWA1-like n=1 Tax=Sitophilus oryzae TaxID=7048 RepID=A0A6J2X235_SITOR|nr:cell wall protein AWA1-like [Sitophilus oryzae]